MGRIPTSDEARAMQAARQVHHTGKKRVPRKCPKCGVRCPTARGARAHCRVNRPQG